MTVVISALLILEAIATAVRIADRLPMLVVDDTAARLVLLLRAGVGALELMSGWWLRTGRPAGRIWAPVALIASAVLTTVEIGGRVASSDLSPGWRWPYVGAYGLYAVVASLVVRSSRIHGE